MKNSYIEAIIAGSATMMVDFKDWLSNFQHILWCVILAYFVFRITQIAREKRYVKFLFRRDKEEYMKNHGIDSVEELEKMFNIRPWRNKLRDR